MIFTVLLAAAAVSPTVLAYSQTQRYFMQEKMAWQGLFVNTSAPPAIRINYDWTPDYSGENETPALLMNSTNALATEAVFADGSGATPLSSIVCKQRRVTVRYVVEYLTPYGDFAASGLHHKVVLASDDEYTGWPAGLGFAFGSGTITQLVRFANYDYGNPVAFVYVHNANNTCFVQAKNNCTVLQNRSIAGGRTYAGNYTVAITALIDTDTALMRAESFAVHLHNDTYDGNVFDILASDLATVPPVNASRWLSTTSTKAARVYFMEIRTHLILRQFLVDVAEMCDIETTKAPDTTVITVAETSTSSSSIPLTTSMVLPPSADQSLTTTTESVVESITIPAAESSGKKDSTFILFIVIASLVFCFGVIGLIYMCRKQIRGSACCQRCYMCLPCRKILCCCCATQMEKEISSADSEDPMLVQINRADTTMRPDFEVAAHNGRASGRQNAVNENYDYVHLPPGNPPSSQAANSQDIEYGVIPVRYVAGVGAVAQHKEGYDSVRPVTPSNYNAVREETPAKKPSIYERLTMRLGVASQSAPRSIVLPKPEDYNPQKPNRPIPIYDSALPFGGKSSDEEREYEFGGAEQLEDVSSSDVVSGSSEQSTGGTKHRKKRTQYEQASAAFKQ